MNISDIMEREIADIERKEREAREARDRADAAAATRRDSVATWACIVSMIVAIIGAEICCIMQWQTRRDLEAAREREAAEDREIERTIRAMTNAELLADEKPDAK